MEVTGATSSTGPSPSASFAGQKECAVTGANDGPVLLVAPVTSMGVDDYLVAVAGPRTPFDAAGFPGMTVKQASTPKACFSVVDVADGQLLSVKVVKSFEPLVPQDTLCAALPRIATAITAAVPTAAGS